MSEYVRWIFSQGVLSQTLSVVGLVVLLLSIAQLCRILAEACVRALRSWLTVARYARRAALARERGRQARAAAAAAPDDPYGIRNSEKS